MYCTYTLHLAVVGAWEANVLHLYITFGGWRGVCGKCTALIHYIWRLADVGGKCTALIHYISTICKRFGGLSYCKGNEKHHMPLQ